jgi:predicted phage terminase large subunit-like protein
MNTANLLHKEGDILNSISPNLIERELKIRAARKNFWSFCQALDPKFYRDTRPHLKQLCTVLESFYRGQLLKDNAIPYDCLMINMAPRLGKSRTLILFNQWVFGQNIQERVISASYNDNVASDFSRYTRDGIAETKNLPSETVYSDIFPDVRIKQGNASFEKFALEGQFFSFLSAGICGSVTGRGGSIIEVDDPIKNAEEANSELYLDKVWSWWTGTLLSRAEEGAKRIICMTRWCKKDLCGRILDSDDAENWYVLSLPAYNEETDSMLCEELLSRKRLERLRNTMDPLIFQANYLQNAVNAEGRLYPDFKEYNDLPKDELGNCLCTQTISYSDTADTGSDHCVTIAGKVYKGELFITDVYYTKEPMEVSEVKTADFLVKNEVIKAKIESNAGGRGFARNVERIIWEKHKTRKVIIEWFHQSANKEARILTASGFICNHIYFPKNWNNRWPEFYQHLVSYQREGKSKHDDFEDCLTGLAEMVDKKTKDLFINIDPSMLTRGLDRQNHWDMGY